MILDGIRRNNCLAAPNETLGWRLWGGDSGGASDDLGRNAEPRKLFPKLPVGGDSGGRQRRLGAQRGASEIISEAPCGWRFCGGDSWVKVHSITQVGTGGDDFRGW